MIHLLPSASQRQPGHLRPFLVLLRTALITVISGGGVLLQSVITNSIGTTVILGRHTCCELTQGWTQAAGWPGKPLPLPELNTAYTPQFLFEYSGITYLKSPQASKPPKQTNHRKSELKSTGGKKLSFPCVWSLMQMSCFHNTDNERTFIFGCSLG